MLVKNCPMFMFYFESEHFTSCLGYGFDVIKTSNTFHGFKFMSSLIAQSKHFSCIALEFLSVPVYSNPLI